MSLPDSNFPDARREALALALARGLSVRAAARKIGCAESTAFAWRLETGFSERVAVLRSELFCKAVAVLAAFNGRAVAVLGTLLRSENEKVRLQAARSVLELGHSLRSDGELEARVAAIERLLGKKGRRL
jgi:transposase-like protein